MKNITTIPVAFPDSKRRLELYECVEEDHLACQEWLDRHLRGDYLFKKQHLRSIITRPTSCLFAILLDGLYVGTAVVYAGSVLHNIMIAEEFRGLGIGEAVIRHLAPSVIRAKTNMKAGDPVPFYNKLGYVPTAADADRPHIIVMEPAKEATTLGAASPPSSVMSSPPAPVVQHLACPPEYTAAEVDAAKWRALKQRQKVRQAAKKEAKRLEANDYASQYAVPRISADHFSMNGFALNTHRE